MRGIVLVLVAVLAIEHAYGHLCLFSPHQRGTEQDLNSKGSKDCLLLAGPCGNRSAMEPMVSYMAGSMVSIVFQKNLDHWNKDNPGNFTIMIGGMMDMKMMELGEVPDTATPSGYIYSPLVKMPDMPMEHAVLQVVYNTNNPQAPAAFYQCADVRVMKR